MTKLRITYTKSSIGYSQDQKDTVRSLGLRKLNSTALHNDTPAIRGMAFKVRHLVTVEELADDSAQKPAKAKTVRPVKTAFAPAAVAETPAVVEAPVAASPAVTKTLLIEETPEVTEAPEVVEVPEVAEVPEVVETPTKADDLEMIEGIGPKIASVLNAAGIATFADLAAADTDRLSEILAQEPNLRLADSTTWPEQAALAAAGDWDAFKALTEQLKGGKRA